MKLIRIIFMLFLSLAIAADGTAIAAPVPAGAAQAKKRSSAGKKTGAKKAVKSESAPGVSTQPAKPAKPVRTPVVRGDEILQLKAKKDSESKLYGYENAGPRYYWWAEAHYMGSGKDQLNQGHSTQWVIAPQYDRAAKEFSEGLAAVELNGKVGFIDRNNRFIIPPQFEPMDDLYGFRYGMAAVKLNGKYGFIDKRGHFVIEPQYDGAENFGDDYLAVVKTGKKFGCIDLRGDLAVPCDYIAKEVMKTVPLKNKPYREAKKRAKEAWDQGYYAEAQSAVKSVADEVNKNIANPDFTEAEGSRAPEGAIKAGDGIYLITNSEGKMGASDSYGRALIPCIHNRVKYDMTQRLFLVDANAGISSPNGGIGIANTGGGWIIPPVFTTVGDFDASGYAPVTVGAHSGKVDVFGMVDEPLLEKLLQSSLEEKGTEYTKRLLGILPTCAPAHNNMGIYYASEQDNLKDAIHHFTVAHNLAPENEDFNNNMKAAKSTRNNRRWNRVMNGLTIAAAVVSLGTMTYSVAKGVPLESSSFSGGGSGSAGGGSSYGSGGSGGKGGGSGRCSACQGSGNCSPKSGTGRKKACHGSGLCGFCHGTGWIQAGSGQADCTQCVLGKCSTCGGTGKCPKCHGTGK